MTLYDHVDDEFIEKYNYLKEAGIIFDNLNQLKNHLNKYWNNIDKWWLSQKTQKFNYNSIKITTIKQTFSL